MLDDLELKNISDRNKFVSRLQDKQPRLLETFVRSSCVKKKVELEYVEVNHDKEMSQVQTKDDG